MSASGPSGPLVQRWSDMVPNFEISWQNTDIDKSVYPFPTEHAYSLWKTVDTDQLGSEEAN